MTSRPFTDFSELTAFDATVLALGGASWEDPGEPRWPEAFERQGIALTPFAPDNVGFAVEPWPRPLVNEAERQPLKDVVLTTKRGSKRGDILITEYGIEGTPVYWVGCAGVAALDLAPAMEERAIFERLDSSKENLAPLRRVKKLLSLSPAAQALLFHLSAEVDRADLGSLCRRIKSLPLNLIAPRPLSEAISSSGGVAWSEVGEDLQLKKAPGVFVAGEMLDWTAPTGGYLIQACVAMGAYAGNKCLKKTRA